MKSGIRTNSARTFNVFHDHAEVPACLEGAEHADHEGVLSEGQDVPLHEGLLDLIPQNQVLLVDLLHSEALAGLFVPHQEDSPEEQQRNRKLKGSSALEVMASIDCYNREITVHFISKKDPLPICPIADELNVLKVFFTRGLHLGLRLYHCTTILGGSRGRGRGNENQDCLPEIHGLSARHSPLWSRPSQECLGCHCHSCSAGPFLQKLRVKRAGWVERIDGNGIYGISVEKMTDKQLFVFSFRA